MISATVDVRSVDNFVRDYICSHSVYSPVDPSVCRPIEIPDVPLLTNSANTLSKLTKRTTTIHAFRLQLYSPIDSALSSSSTLQSVCFLTSCNFSSKISTTTQTYMYFIDPACKQVRLFARVYILITHFRADEIKIDSFYLKYLENLLKHPIIKMFFQ